LKAVLKEVTDSGGNIILFIDEIHTAVGAGATKARWMPVNLQPMLTVSCAIGATNLMSTYIEKMPP